MEPNNLSHETKVIYGVRKLQTLLRLYFDAINIMKRININLEPLYIFSSRLAV